MRKVCLRLTQPFSFVLGLLTLGDIDSSADYFNKSTRRIENWVSNHVNMSDFATGMKDPVIHLIVVPGANRSLMSANRPCLAISMTARAASTGVITMAGSRP